MWFGGRSDRRDNNDSGPLGVILVILAFALLILAPFAAQLMQFAMSRRRELLADASGVQLTRYPPGSDLGARRSSRTTRPSCTTRPVPPPSCGSRARSSATDKERGRGHEEHLAQPRCSTPIRRSTSGSPRWRRCETGSLGAGGRRRRVARRSGRVRRRWLDAPTAKKTKPAAATTTTTARRRRSRRSPGCPTRPARAQGRPVVSVKIENTPTARPRPASTTPTSSGRRSWRARPPGSSRCSTRQVPDVVGPVRSVRLTDPLIVWPVGGVFAYSGGAKYAVDGIAQAPVVLRRREQRRRRDVPRRAAGRAPHNLYARPRAALRHRRRAGAAPAAVRLRRAAPVDRRATPVVSVHIGFSSRVRPDLHLGRGVGDLDARRSRVGPFIDEVRRRRSRRPTWSCSRWPTHGGVGRSVPRPSSSARAR